MKKFDIKYAVKGKQFDLNIRAKTDPMINGVYYSLYMRGVWVANIYKTSVEQYKALSYTSAFHQNQLEAIGRQIDMVN